MFDTIIYHGEIVDGLKNSSYQNDLGIVNGRIAAIDDLSGACSKECIDATGLIVSPGFIDIHTHSDFTLLVNGAAESQIHQGVTLEVIGQCGFSCAPLGDIESMKKTILGYHDGVDITWNSFGEYLERLEKEKIGIHVMASVGHGAIRRAAGLKNRAPSESDLEKMIQILDSSLEAGACGLSTGLEYFPGKNASIDELVSLCKSVKKYDALYSTHVRNRDIHYDLGFSEALATSRLSGVKLQISHIQPKYGAPPFAAENTLSMINWSKKAGFDIAFDVIPHDWAHTLVTTCLPSWAFEGGIEALMERLRNKDQREKMKYNPRPMWQLVAEHRWNDIILFRTKKNQSYIGLTIEEIGQIRGVDPYDAIFDILLEEGEELFNVLWTSRSFSESDIDFFLMQPDCMVISDSMSLAPYGLLKDTIGSLSGYGWTARLFQHYIREKSVISLEEAVHKITALPASRLKLSDRGVLRKGAIADITVFDRDAIANQSTVKNPNLYPTGIEYVFLCGQLVIQSGKHLPVSAGHVIRYQQ